jgi:uncharacterized membrane protein
MPFPPTIANTKLLHRIYRTQKSKRSSKYENSKQYAKGNINDIKYRKINNRSKKEVITTGNNHIW